MDHVFLIQQANKQEEVKEKKIEATEEQKTTLINLYSWATILPKELIDLKNKINNEKRIKRVQEALPRLTTEIEDIRWDTTMAQTSPEIQAFQVTTLQTKTQKFGVRLEKNTEPINSNISFWSETRKEWMSKKEQILRIDEQEEITMVLGVEQHKVLIETVDEAIELIEKHLALILLTGKKIGDLQIVLYTIDSDLQSLDIELKATSIQQTAPSMLSGEFYSRINYSLFSQSFHTTKRFFLGAWKVLKTIHAILF